jgi:hypothetical protein
MRVPTSVLLAWSAGLAAVKAQFPPKPEGVTRLKSKFHENITISFKEVKRATLRESERSSRV